MESICSIFKLPKPERRRRDLDPRIIEKKKKSVDMLPATHKKKPVCSAEENHQVEWRRGRGKVSSPSFVNKPGDSMHFWFPPGLVF